ncbi:MAG: hypothetical protein AABW73_03455 [Nanoarchaeota archaeon]
MRKGIITLGVTYSIISIISLIMITPYLLSLTKLNITDVKEGGRPAFPWTFVIIVDLLPIIIIGANILMWNYMKRKNTKMIVTTIITPIIYTAIITAYFLLLII